MTDEDAMTEPEVIEFIITKVPSFIETIGCKVPGFEEETVIGFIYYAAPDTRHLLLAIKYNQKIREKIRELLSAKNN